MKKMLQAKTFVLLISSLIILNSCNYCCDYGPHVIKDLNINYCAQEKSNWCWAASSEMVMKFLLPNNNYHQCDQAKFVCIRAQRISSDQAQIMNCSNQGSDTLNVTSWPILDQSGFSSVNTDQSLHYFSWQDMRTEIDSNRPILLTWKWDGGDAAHMVVMDGYSVDNGIPYAQIRDPNIYFSLDSNFQTIRTVKMSYNRYGPDHTLGRCYYNIIHN